MSAIRIMAPEERDAMLQAARETFEAFGLSPEHGLSPELRTLLRLLRYDEIEIDLVSNAMRDLLRPLELRATESPTTE